MPQVQITMAKGFMVFPVTAHAFRHLLRVVQMNFRQARQELIHDFKKVKPARESRQYMDPMNEYQVAVQFSPDGIVREVLALKDYTREPCGP